MLGRALRHSRLGRRGYRTIALTVDEDKFATLRLDRPLAHNAFNTEMIHELLHCLSPPSSSTSSTITDDTPLLVGSDGNRLVPKVRGLFLCSTGKTFCAGGDLKSMKQLGSTSTSTTTDSNMRDARLLAKLLHTLNTLPLPTVCLVQGNAFGGGVGLCSVCDVAVAVKSALFGLTEVKLGMIPATISPYVVQRIGASQARRYFLTAERFSAQTAREIGLVHELCDDEAGLEQWKQKLKLQLEGNAPLACQAAKDLIFYLQTASSSTTQVMEETANRLAAQRRSPEAQQGIQAFLDKQPPKWKI